MTEIHGACGFLEIDRSELSFSRFYQDGDNKPAWQVVMEIGYPGKAWKPVGTLVFDAGGRQISMSIDGMGVARTELEIWEQQKASGWPIDRLPPSQLSFFVARVAKHANTLDKVRTCIEYPVQLPFDGTKIIRFLEPVPVILEEEEAKDGW